MRPLLPDTGFLCKKRRLEQGFKAHWLETWLTQEIGSNAAHAANTPCGGPCRPTALTCKSLNCLVTRREKLRKRKFGFMPHRGGS